MTEMMGAVDTTATATEVVSKQAGFPTPEELAEARGDRGGCPGLGDLVR